MPKGLAGGEISSTKMFKASPRRTMVNTGQRISRKYRKAYLRKLQRKEFNRLKRVIPSVAEDSDVSKVSIVQEATKYIQELHDAVSDKLKLFGFDIPSTDHQTLLQVLQCLLPTTVPDYSYCQITGQPALSHPLNCITPPCHNQSSQEVPQKSLRHWRM